MEVDYEILNRVGYVTLNRPEKRNALNREMVKGLSGIFDDINSDKSKVIVLQSRGDVFCSGADLQTLKELQKNSYEDNLNDSTILKDLMLKIYQCPKPVIANMKGPAIAGGAGLVTLCDFVFAVPEAKLGYTEVRIGFVPAIVMIFLIRKIGEARAKELLLGGELVDAITAKEYGLINRIASREAIDIEVEEFASRLVSKNSGSSMALTKQLINSLQDLKIEDALKLAAENNARARSSEDCHKGIEAFLNKKIIDW